MNQPSTPTSLPPKYEVERLHQRLEIILDDASEATKNATTLLLLEWRFEVSNVFLGVGSGGWGVGITEFDDRAMYINNMDTYTWNPKQPVINGWNL